MWISGNISPSILQTKLKHIETAGRFLTRLLSRSNSKFSVLTLISKRIDRCWSISIFPTPFHWQSIEFIGGFCILNLYGRQQVNIIAEVRFGFQSSTRSLPTMSTCVISCSLKRILMLRCLLKNQILPLQRKLLYGFLMNTTDNLQFSTDVDFSLSFLC